MEILLGIGMGSIIKALVCGFLGALLFGLYRLVTWVINLRRVVPTNMVHIVQYKDGPIAYGRDKDNGTVYYEWPPYIPVLGVQVTEFPESNFQIMLTDYESYDSVRLPFKVDIVAFFRVENPETAAQRIASFPELQKQLKSIMEGSIRRIMSCSTLEEIMSERAKFGDSFTKETADQIREWGVKPVKMIEFMDIRDTSGSHVIEQMMSKEKSRIEKDARITIAINNQEAHLKEIEAERNVNVNKQDAEQQVGLRTAEKEQHVGIAKEKAQQEIKTQANITAALDMAVQQTNRVRAAEIQKETDVIDAERAKSVATIQAAAAADSNVLTAEGEKKRVEIEAAGRLNSAKCNAEAIRQEGEAKAHAEKAMQMVPVETQIALAQEIGSNENYMNYLVTVKQIEVSAEVGKEFAASLQTADLKIIANSNNVQEGIQGLAGTLSGKGGSNIAAMLENLTNTPVGAALMNKFIAPKAE